MTDTAPLRASRLVEATQPELSEDSEMNEHQVDELAQARVYLLSAPGPVIADEAAALRLLAQLDIELSVILGDGQHGPDPYELAGHRRRRAYVWAHLAQLRPEAFEEAAAAAVSAWNEAEGVVTRAALASAAAR